MKKIQFDIQAVSVTEDLVAKSKSKQPDLDIKAGSIINKVLLNEIVDSKIVTKHSIDYLLDDGCTEIRQRDLLDVINMLLTRYYKNLQ